MSMQKLRPSYNFIDDRIDELKRVVPEAFVDGSINWDLLREALGNYLEDDSVEHFGLSWPGKREARQLAATPSRGTLAPLWGDGINEAETHNIFIEGDNLEVLKTLQKSYAGRIKFIYIDPPYNTGNDFLYADNFLEPTESYLRRTGQTGDNEQLLVSNPRSDGRFHSIWLSMIYPRLLLARQLLKDDGVIFASIGEEEVHHLRLAMSEVFGEGNFLSQITRIAKTASNKGTFFAPSTDYLLSYAKNKDVLPGFSDKVDTGLYKKKDENGYYRDDVALYQAALDTRPNQRYFIECPDGSWVIPPGNTFPPDRPIDGDGVWRWTEETLNKNRHLLVFKESDRTPLINERGEKARYNIYTKSYLTDRQESGTVPRNILTDFINRKGADYLKTLDLEYSYSKPYQLIQWLLEITNTRQDDIVLDFFAGSSTTADAVLRSNAVDGQNRRFIMIQLPEALEEKSTEFSDIAALSKERIRRVISQIQANRQGGNGQLSMDLEEPFLDLGFKSYRFERSQFKEWETVQDIVLLEEQLTLFETPLIENWSSDTLLVEVILLEGFPVDSTINQLEGFALNKVYLARSDFHEHSLYICLDKTISGDVTESLSRILSMNDVFVCLDIALSDESKIRLSDCTNIHII